jgi:ABC-2 type transport system permease protein
MPIWLQAITYAVPARYYLVVLRGVILKGAPLWPYREQIACLALYAAIMLIFASWRLARDTRGVL